MSAPLQGERIEIISASAGSGKTRELGEVLFRAVTEEGVRPEHVVATTFTRRAAAELRERVRARLLAAGKVAEAEALTRARVGTVHSVCAGLLSDFAFDLGLSPDLAVIEPAEARAALERALAGAATSEEAEELAEFTARWKDLEWQVCVRRLVELATSNAIGPEELAGMARQSMDTFLELLGSEALPEAEADRAPGELFAEVERLNAAILAKPAKPAGAKRAKKGERTQDDEQTLVRLAPILAILRQGLLPTWDDLRALGKYVPEDSRASSLAAMHLRFPAFRREAARLVELVFGLAARVMRIYRADKETLGGLDYNDLEARALELLGREDLRERLGAQLGLVVVDEFQDTSPMQLAIFLGLSRLARRNVWVGDQKQAIYGFRGTDPRLMDAALEAVSGAGDPLRILGTSHRSRPELVRLTSEVFARAFEGQGIPPERVRLQPMEQAEPGGLGPTLERWLLPGGRANLPRFQALAGGVKTLLAAGTLVRTRDGKQTRPLRPGDVAVLCSTNDRCFDVAQCLRALGMRAVVARGDPFGGPVVQALLAGLRLWVDTRDRLARAELTRLLTHPADPDAFLAAALGGALENEAEGEAVWGRVVRARTGRETAGPVEAVDRVIEALELRALALAWGDPSEPLAGLEAVRQRAVALARTGGGLAGVAGLLQEIALAQEEPQEERAPLADDPEAVVVSTWHSAKGLEWPVVILTDLDKDREGRASALGVEVETLEDEPELDVEQPLADRWLRCWPSPYHSAVTHSPLHERLAENGFQKRAKNRARREALRVLYVCWTRARDRLVLAGAPGVLGKGMAAALELEEPPGEEGLANITWHGARVELQVRRLAAEEGEQREEEPGADFVPAEPRERPRARVLPSEEKEAARAGEPVRLGPPLELRAGTDPIPAGDVLHAFLAADRDGLSDESRRAIARTLLDGHGLASVMPRDLLEAGDRLRRFVAGRWPGAVWRRELPLAMRLEGGSQMFGSCDLALELEAGWVVIDHKGMKVRGEDEQTAAGEKAAGYGGQLRAYARMLQAATGKPVIGAWIHAAALGLAIPVEVQGRKD